VAVKRPVKRSIPAWPRVWCGGPAEPQGAPAVDVTFDVDTRNTSNAGGGRGKAGWAAVHRAEEARNALGLALTFDDDRIALLAARGPWCVRLTRLSSSKRPLDDDAPPGALKAIRDAVAFALEVDDGDLSIAFCYAQAQRPGPLGVRVEIWGVEATP
jgi:hypothetical protein